MPTNHHKVIPVPQPTKIFFDPFNSSSTGHQTAPAQLAGSTSWRNSRTFKLSHQLQDATGRGGSTHLSDLVGAGSETYGKDGRKDNGNWEKGAPGLREKGWQDIRHLMQGSRKRRRSSSSTNTATSMSMTTKHIEQADSADLSLPEKKKIKSNHHRDRSHLSSSSNTPLKGNGTTRSDNDNHGEHLPHHEKDSTPPPQPPQIFRGLTIYLNGSTTPLVSDHRLKHLFAVHGGNASLALGRRTVTHVILGKTCGGGLAASKIQKEITTVGGKSIKFVTAQWVLDSVEKGIRQPEGRYRPPLISGKIGGFGQKSVAGLFARSS